MRKHQKYYFGKAYAGDNKTILCPNLSAYIIIFGKTRYLIFDDYHNNWKYNPIHKVISILDHPFQLTKKFHNKVTMYNSKRIIRTYIYRELKGEELDSITNQSTWFRRNDRPGKKHLGTSSNL